MSKRIRKVVEVEVGYFAKDGYFSPRGPGLAPIELPFPWFQPGERVLVEITKLATNKEKSNGKSRYVDKSHERDTSSD